MKQLIFAVTLVLATSGCYENFSKPEPMYTLPFHGKVLHPYDLAAGPEGRAWSLMRADHPEGDSEFFCSKLEPLDEAAPNWRWGEPRTLGRGKFGKTAGTILGDLSDPDGAYAALAYEFPEPEISLQYIRVLRTTNGGSSWDGFDPLFLEDNDEPFVQVPLLAQSPIHENTLVLVAGSDRSIRVSRSDEKGAFGSWSTDPWTINTASAGNELELLGLQYLDDGTLVMFYCVDDVADNARIYPNYYVRRSTDDGTTWSEYIQVNSHLSGDMNLGGDLFYSGGLTLHATWGTDANYKYTTSTDGGLTWEDNTALAWDPGYNPQLTGLRDSGSVVLTVHTSLGSDLGTNLHYHELLGSAWSERRRINHAIGACTAQGGLTTTTDGTVVAAWLNEYEGTHTAYAAYSHPDRVDDCGIAFDEATLAGDSEVRRGDPFAFSYNVGNYTGAPVELDVYTDVYGKQHFIYRELQRTTVHLDAGEETTIDVSLTVAPGAPHQDYVVGIYADKNHVTTDYEQFQVSLVP